MTSPDLCKLPVNAIGISEGRRSVGTKALAVLTESMNAIGLQCPIIVKRTTSDDGVQVHTLVAGRHRLEAARRLGWTHIDCIVKSGNRFGKIEAEMCEIAENLHRAELMSLERDEQIARWVELSKSQRVAESATLGGGQPHERGKSQASRELGVSRGAVKNASKVAALSDEAKEAAREVGLDNNQSALLEAVKEPTPKAQVTYLRERSGKPAKHADDPLNDFEAEERQIAALMVAWNKAGKLAREKFLDRIDNSVMGKKWA